VPLGCAVPADGEATERMTSVGGRCGGEALLHWLSLGSAVLAIMVGALWLLLLYLGILDQVFP
jgi:hypothetical protein